MKYQQPLFDALASDVTPANGTSLLIPSSGARKLSPVQKQFNQLLQKIEASRAALLELQDIEAKWLPERARRLEPLLAQTRSLQEQMVVFLDQRLLTPKGLSKKVRDDVTTILVSLAEGLIYQEPSNPMIAEIHQRHAPDGDEEEGNEMIMAEMHEMLSEVFGMEFDLSDQIDSPDALLEAALGKARAQQEAAEEARIARKAKRKKTPLQQKQAEEALDADKAVREIYRKLASALHPDREPDAAERERKAALMAQVNAANDRRDLLALLELQLQVEQLNPGDVAIMADEKLRHFIRVLKEQEKSLREEKLQREMQVRQMLDLAWNTPVSVRGIDAGLRLQAQHMQANISMMQHDLTAIRQDAELKRWAKQQIELINDPLTLLDSLMR